MCRASPLPGEAQVQCDDGGGVREVFCALPLGHVLNGRVLVVHGGLFSQDGIKVWRLKSILLHPRKELFEGKPVSVFACTRPCNTESENASGCGAITDVATASVARR